MTTETIQFRVWDDGKLRTGSAKKILDEIRAAGAKRNDEFRKISTETYANDLIEDAPYFINKSLMKALAKEPYPTKYDRALNYLASMPTSRLRILSMDKTQAEK